MSLYMINFFSLHHSQLFLRYHNSLVSRILTILLLYENVGILVKLWFRYIILCLSRSRSVLYLCYWVSCKKQRIHGECFMVFKCMYEDDIMARCIATYCYLSKYFEQINASKVHIFSSNLISNKFELTRSKTYYI
jgi:hypothetical protein